MIKITKEVIMENFSVDDMLFIIHMKEDHNLDFEQLGSNITYWREHHKRCFGINCTKESFHPRKENVLHIIERISNMNKMIN